jgi:cytochrome c-type biogenesis protein CcmH
MIGFWLAAVSLLLLGYAFFIPALRGRTGGGRPSRTRLNLLLHRQRQQELALEAQSPEQRDSLAAESERNLLGDLEAAGERTPQASTEGRTSLAVALALLPLAALLAYLGLGRPDLLGQRPGPDMAEIEAGIRHLAEKLQQQPDDLQGWLLLGRSLQATRQPEQALRAYQFAMKLAPDDLDVRAIYAQALAEAGQGKLDGEPTAIVEGILQKDPQHKTALWMAGAAAAQRGDGAKAAGYWQRLKRQLPPGSPEAQQIEAYIAEVQGAPARSGLRLRVTVTLAGELKGRASPEDAVFIFARAADGPPMPLAVIRKQVKDLPAAVVLDDSMAMVQGMSLASFDRVVLGARISKSGEPMPAPGDLQGLSEPFAPENEAAYSVTIDRVVGQEGK